MTLTDAATLEDRLYLHDTIGKIGKQLAECKLPQIFGIHGDWGSGKTSILHQLCLHLTNRCSRFTDDECDLARKNIPGWKKYEDEDLVRVVWFEAWRYQHEPAPVVALIHEIRDQLSLYSQIREGVLSNTKKFLKSIAAKGIDVGIQAASMHLGSIAEKIGLDSLKGEEIVRAVTEGRKETLPTQVIRDQLEQGIKNLLAGVISREGKKPRRALILIDDLDRCEPEAAFKLLEGLKIYLAIPNCVFLLAMNQQVIEDAIAKHLPGEKKQDVVSAMARERASSYMEKLCQNVWRLGHVLRPKELLLGWLNDLEV